MATKPVSLIQLNNQSNIDVCQGVNEDYAIYRNVDNRTTIENDLAQSQKDKDFANYFLTYKSWIITNKSINSNMRHHTRLKNAVLQRLVDQHFLHEIKGGLKSQNARTTPIDIWVKCMPPSVTDFTIIQQWNDALSLYDVSWDEYVSTLSHINLIEELYMTDSFNEFINANYEPISMFIHVRLHR
jgi:hypothetical protein